MSKDDITIQSPITEEKILGSPITEEKVIDSGITTNLVIQSPIGIESEEGPPIPTDGLIGEWLFSGNANDTSGNDNHGIVTGAVLTTDRHSNTDSAYLFNGSSDYIKVLNNSVFDLGTGDFTFSLWAKQDPANSNYLLTKDFFTHYEIRTLNTTEALFILANNQAKAAIAATPNVWTHYVITRVSGLITWYEDNIQIGAPVTIALTMTNTQDLYFGARGNLTRWLNGSLDDIRIYNRALTANERLILFEE